MQERTCPECGEQVDGRPNKTYCSDRCRNRVRARRYRASATGVAYYQQRRDEGGYAAGNRRHRARNRTFESKTCPYCSATYERPGRARRSTCGADICRQAYNLDKCHERNARLRDARVEQFTRVDVFERDDWVCQLCGDPVDRDASPKTPWSASLDHVVPLSRGGEHSMTNTQCAHLTCNQQKSNSVEMGALSV